MGKPVRKGISIIIVLCMVLGIFAGVGGTAVQAAGADVPVPNGSYESGLESWTTSFTPAEGASPITTPGGWSPAGGGSNRLDYYLAGTAYTANTSQTLTGLTNGIYTLSAWVERGADFTESYMYAQPLGGEEVKKDIPASSQWVKITQTVTVSSNSLTIGFNGAGKAGAGNYMGVDLVALTLDEAAPAKELANASFEEGANGWEYAFGPANGADPYAVTAGWSPADGGDNRLNVWSASAYTADVKQTLTGIENGTYTLSAWIASGGGFNENYMYAQTPGKADAVKVIPTSAAWTRIELPLEVLNNTVPERIIGLRLIWSSWKKRRLSLSRLQEWIYLTAVLKKRANRIRALAAGTRRAISPHRSKIMQATEAPAICRITQTRTTKCPPRKRSPVWITVITR
jgi:hypothetical protein